MTPSRRDVQPGAGFAVAVMAAGRGAAAEQVQGIILVLAQDLQLDRAGHGGQGRQRPGVQRIAVDHQGQAGSRLRDAGLQFLGQVGGEHLELPGEAHHGLPGLGEFEGPGPAQHGAADGGFEGADALADGGGRDRELAGGGVETAVGEDRRQGPGLVRMNVNH